MVAHNFHVDKNDVVAVATTLTKSFNFLLHHVQGLQSWFGFISPSAVLMLDHYLQGKYRETIRVDKKDISAIAQAVVTWSWWLVVLARLLAFIYHFLIGRHVHQKFSHVVIFRLRTSIYFNSWVVGLEIAFLLLHVLHVVFLVTETIVVILLILVLRHWLGLVFLDLIDFPQHISSLRIRAPTLKKTIWLVTTLLSRSIWFSKRVI
jgi:hypothetical protein